MARDPTLGLLHNALAHFHELPFLSDHPLSAQLGQEGAATPAALQRRLLSAIEQLRPIADTAPGAPLWRQYYYLRWRYLEGRDLAHIQQDLAIGDRQARREHHAALATLAVTLGLVTGPSHPPLPPADGEGRDDDPATDGEPAAATALAAELARMEEEATIELVDLRPLAADTSALVASLATRHRVTIRLALADGVAVVGTPTMLRQLLLNLLGYLLNHYPGRDLWVTAQDGDSEVALRFRLEHPAPAQCLAPSPPGAGEAVARMLDAARRLAEAQGGRLVVLGDDSGATEAVLALPMAHAMTVLVVDDNPDIAHLFRRYLHGTACRVVQARHQADIIEVASRMRPDVITLDVLMPIQDGWDLLRQLRDHPTTRAMPIIVCSVLPERELALSLGVDGFLAKPVTRQSLRAALAPYQRPAGQAR